MTLDGANPLRAVALPAAMVLLTSLALGVALVALYAAGYVAAAWHFASRAGRNGLLGAWLAGALLFWLVSLVRLHVLGAAVNLPPKTAADRLAVFGFLAFVVLGVGLATLSVRRRLARSPDGRLTFGAAIAGVGAFFTGMLLALLPILVSDLWAPGRQMTR